MNCSDCPGSFESCDDCCKGRVEEIDCDDSYRIEKDIEELLLYRLHKNLIV